MHSNNLRSDPESRMSIASIVSWLMSSEKITTRRRCVLKPVDDAPACRVLLAAIDAVLETVHLIIRKVAVVLILVPALDIVCVAVVALCWVVPGQAAALRGRTVHASHVPSHI